METGNTGSLADGVSGYDGAYAVLQSMMPLPTFKAALTKSRGGSRKPSQMCRGALQHSEVLQLMNLKRILADIQSPYLCHAIGVMWHYCYRVQLRQGIDGCLHSVHR
jgi:hypothetical protein